MSASSFVSVPVASATCVPKGNARAVGGFVRSVVRLQCSEWTKRTVSNGVKTRQMMVWNPFNNRRFETFSYLPPLADDEISRQVDYITSNSWVACLEFTDKDQAYVQDIVNERFGTVSSGYYDNRYWTMWKLPMFGCTDPRQVLAEIANCKKAFPESYVRLVAFDAIRQVQIASFIVNQPVEAAVGAPIDSQVIARPARPESNFSSSWDSPKETSRSSWSYDWNTKEETKEVSWSSSAGEEKKDWSYDWSKKEEVPAYASSSWGSSKVEEKQDWTYDWSKREESSTGSSNGKVSSTSWGKADAAPAYASSSWDLSKAEEKQDWTYDWSKREESSTDSTNGRRTYAAPAYGDGAYAAGSTSKRALVQEVISVSKTIRDLEIKYAEIDVEGAKRTARERRSELEKILAEKTNWDKTEKYHIQQQMKECQKQITDLQRKISEVSQMIQSRDAKFAVQIAACETDLAAADAALVKVKELEQQFSQKEAILEDLTEKLVA